jgi:excisionase family DNA binding protein
MTDMPTLPRIGEVADHLGVSVRHVRRLVFERRIPFLKWGHLLRFDPGDIAAWLDAQRVASSGGEAGSRDAAPRSARCVGVDVRPASEVTSDHVEEALGVGLPREVTRLLRPAWELAPAGPVTT